MSVFVVRHPEKEGLYLKTCRAYVSYRTPGSHPSSSSSSKDSYSGLSSWVSDPLRATHFQDCDTLIKKLSHSIQIHETFSATPGATFTSRIPVKLFKAILENPLILEIKEADKIADTTLYAILGETRDGALYMGNGGAFTSTSIHRARFFSKDEAISRISSLRFPAALVSVQLAVSNIEIPQTDNRHVPGSDFLNSINVIKTTSEASQISRDVLLSSSSRPKRKL